MSAWPMVTLGDLCELEIGRTPPRANSRYWGPGHPWLSIADIGQGRELVTTRESITNAAVRECRCRPVPAGALVMSFKLSLGKVGIVRTPMFTNEAIVALRFREPDQADTGYMYHALQSIDFSGVGERAVKGVTLNLASISQLRVPLPPIREQQRIAAILDKADAVRRKRQGGLRLLDDLLRSAFLQTFGDPVRNEKGWELKPLRDVAVVTTGNTPPRDVQAYYGNDIEWTKSDNINTPGHYVTRAREGLSAVGRRVGRTVGADSILMTCIAGSPDCIGNVAITDREVAFNQQINAIEPGAEVDFRFLYGQLLTGKSLVQEASTSSMKGMVSKGQLEKVRVAVPPLHMQTKFGEVFTRLLAARSIMDRALAEAVTLFDSLAQRAFRGES